MSVFTDRPATDHVASNEFAFAIRDGYPVSRGHTLVIPRREFASWFEATAQERAAIFELVETVKAQLDAELHPDGYNLGINCGSAAGQTVMHLHVHVIPRYAGDVPDPRGGVRHVMPGKGNYLAAPLPSEPWQPSHHPQPPRYPQDRRRPAGSEKPSEASPESRAVYSADAAPRLTTNESSSLLEHLEIDLSRASTAELAVAFVQRSGVDRLMAGLEALLQRGGRLRLVTGDYLDVTDPDALRRLHDLSTAHPGSVELRVFQSQGRSFHPKSYLFLRGPDDGVAYVGSSNLSRSALEDGVEWNYRIVTARDREGFAEVRRAFEALFAHPSTRALDEAWIEEYRARRVAHPLNAQGLPPASPGNANEASPEYLATGCEIEPAEPPPEPNEVQREALAALEQTRSAGHRAGLVVMATGLGKTWLAAFDTEKAKRVLFIAHREEILGQAMATFRRVRPQARFGLYDGQRKDRGAEVLFGSIQTLGKRAHLEGFDRGAFDYVVVDEFHHAAAATYRRLIDHFEPGFLLGLTATPERTDGGDLLQLCGENLVYRCDLVEGIDRGLLSPFHYFGVPDEVDYRNIPWRSSRFDEEKLTEAVATRKRARNVLEQWRQRGGARTLAFCVSQRHADFMRDFFREAGVEAAAVHAGESSDPRATSLERLGRGELAVLFAVDMFNEGVDLPQVDTVMMLRPTESRILFLQQLGRGLRRQEGKRLKVVDYIGNHRSFLNKARTLLDLPPGDDRALDAALTKVEEKQWELPQGCEVTYELQTLDLMRALLRLPKQDDALRAYYVDFRERTGARPTAAEAHHDGYNPRAARRSYGSWLRFVEALGDLSEAERAALATQGDFLSELEVTPISRSFKMLVVLAMLNADALPGPGIAIDKLVREFRRLASRTPRLSEDVGKALEDDAELRKMLERNPIDAWVGGKGTGDVSLFEYSAGSFRFRGQVPAEQRAAFQDLVRELADWRLAEYLDRPGNDSEAEGQFTLKVSHANGRPILFLPDRKAHPSLPHGWTRIVANGQEYDADFVKIAVNVVRKPDGDSNELPAILRGWFGADAGLPGTNHVLTLNTSLTVPELRPTRTRNNLKLELWRSYSREQIPPLFGEEFSEAHWNQGFIVRGKNIFLLVTLEKDGMAESFKYSDRLISPDRFLWQSQNRTKQNSKHGRMIRNHAALGISVHLFVRNVKKTASGESMPFVYYGLVIFEKWEGERPITVIWALDSPRSTNQPRHLDHH